MVFTSGGVLSFSNAAYRQMWQHRPESTIADVTITDAIAVWKSHARSGVGWDQIDRYVCTRGARPDRTLQIPLNDGRSMRCSLSSLPPGATLVRFRVANVAGVPTEARRTANTDCLPAS